MLSQKTVLRLYRRTIHSLASHHLLIRQNRIALRAFHRSVSLRSEFDAREATIDRIHHALSTGEATCRDIVSSHLARIEVFNPMINAIISLNPDALHAADELDNRLKSGGGVKGLLFGVPVLLKDNFDAKGMPTTAGCVALKDLRPTKDASVAERLRAEGAIIMGKTNLHEMALEGLTVSSLGGQTFNPYDLTRTPGGSSGGSGAALAASMCVIATGTDTMNSLRSPASAGSLFSLRPSRGLVSRSGVVPCSYSQDTVGPMARTVDDLAVAFEVMRNRQPDIEDQNFRSPHLTYTFDPRASKESTKRDLKGFRLGIIDSFFDRNSDDVEAQPVNLVIDRFFNHLRKAGASFVHLKDQFLDQHKISQLDVVKHEFRDQLDGYLSRKSHQGCFPKSFAELYSSKDYLVIPEQYEHICAVQKGSTKDEEFERKRQAASSLAREIETLFDRHQLDFILYPEQRHLVRKVGSSKQHGRNGHLAVMTGSPVLTVPAGFSEPSPEAPRGVPIGVEMMGRPFSEQDLFVTAKIVEQITRVRVAPAVSDTHVLYERFDEVPVVTPRTDNIAYPVGVH